MSTVPNVPCAGSCGRLLWPGTGALPPGKQTCRECRAEARKRACKQCGKEFQPSAAKKGRVFCDGCLEDYGGGGHRRREKQLCEMCGERYMPPHTNAHSNPGKLPRFCSRDCYYEALRTPGLIDRSNWKPPPRKPKPPQKPKPFRVVILFKRCRICRQWWSPRRRGTVYCPQHGMNERMVWLYHNNPQVKDRFLAAAHARRAGLLGLRPAWLAPRMVAELDNWMCALCCEPIDPHVTGKYDPRMASLDHWIPIRRGGKHELSNVQAAHLGCNWSKNDRLPPAGELSPGDRRALAL